MTPETEPFINCNAPIDWPRLAALLQFRLQRAGEKNATPGLDLATTENIRGEIRCLKNLLDLPNEAARKLEAPPVAPY